MSKLFYLIFISRQDELWKIIRIFTVASLKKNNNFCFPLKWYQSDHFKVKANQLTNYIKFEFYKMSLILFTL